jgi:hypothetical protein
VAPRRTDPSDPSSELESISRRFAETWRRLGRALEDRDVASIVRVVESLATVLALAVAVRREAVRRRRGTLSVADKSRLAYAVGVARSMQKYALEARASKEWHAWHALHPFAPREWGSAMRRWELAYPQVKALLWFAEEGQLDRVLSVSSDVVRAAAEMLFSLRYKDMAVGVSDAGNGLGRVTGYW